MSDWSVFPSSELIDFKTRRVAAFRKNLVELAELELKHAKVIASCREFPLPPESCFAVCPVHLSVLLTPSPAGEPPAVAELSGHPERKYITC